MTRALLLPFCAAALTSVAQSPGFQLVVDPPGDNAYHALADGLVTPDGEIYLLTGFQNIQEPAFILGKYTETGQFLWSRKVEYFGAAQLSPQKVVRATSGDLFVFGTLYATSNDYFITRIAPDGEVQWTRTYRQEQPGNDYGFSSIVATSDGALVVSMGLINRTVTLRLDLDGNLMWSHLYLSDLTSTLKNPGFDFAATSDGGVLLTQKAHEDVFLVRLDSVGGVDWAKRYPNDGYCQTHIALQLSDGDFLIAGSRDAQPFAARISSGGQIVWFKEYAFDEGFVERFDHAVELTDGDLLLSPSSNSSGIMALRITPLGLPVQVRTVEGGGYASVIGRQEEHVVLCGRTLLEVDGGFEEAILLLSTDETLGFDCLQGSTGATAIDVVGDTPIPGYDIVEEAIIQDTVDMLVSAPLFGMRTFCTVNGISSTMLKPWSARPTLLESATEIIIELAGDVPLQTLVRVAVDGRTEPLDAVRTTEGWRVSTMGWTAGSYLLRIMDTLGADQSAVRVVISR